MRIAKRASRREFLKLGALAAPAAIVAAACGSTASPAPAPGKAGESKSAESKSAPSAAQVEVSLWQHLYPPLSKAYETLIAEYHTGHPSTKVNFDAVAADQFEQKLLTSLAAGAGPDIFRMPTWSTAAYVEKGLVKPLDPGALGKTSHDELMNEYDPPSSVQGWVADGKLYAIPIELSVMSTWYRVDLLEQELGITKDKLPKTWDELWDVAVKFTQKDPPEQGQRVGFSYTWNPVWLMHHYSPFIYQQGGAILGEDGKTVTLDSPEGLRALDLLAEPYRKGGANKDFAVPQAFENGQQAIALSGPFLPSTVVAVKPELEYGKNFVEGPFPQTKGGKPAGYTWGPASLVPNPNTKHAAETYDVIKFIWDRPDVFWQIANIMTTRRTFKESDAFKKSPWLPTFMADAQIARPAVETPVYEEIKTAVFQMAQRVVIEGQGSQESLKLAAEDIKRALAR
jgi:multiple sugar transport system substrate-binding protein